MKNIKCDKFEHITDIGDIYECANCGNHVCGECARTWNNVCPHCFCKLYKLS